MKTPFFSLLLGVSVLLLSGLTVAAVLSFSAPSPPIRSILHLVVVIPYFISTYLMVSINSSMMTGPPVVSIERVQHIEGAQEFDEDYNDITTISMKMGLPTVIVMETAQDVEGAQGFDEDYDDIIADVITGHEF